MDLFSKGNLLVGDPPTKFVEANLAAAPLARQGKIVKMGARDVSNTSFRYQRGTGFFRALFDDLARAAEATKKEAHERVTILFVDVFHWVGDDMEELVEWNVEAIKRGPNSVKIYGLFHDPKEVNCLVAKAHRDSLAQELFEKAPSYAIVFSSPLA